MTVAVLPDGELIVADVLRGAAEIVALAGDRIFTDRVADEPCYRVSRTGGIPVIQYPLHLDRAVIQVDAWAAVRAGTKGDARLMIETARAVLDSALRNGATPTTGGVVTGTEWGTTAYLADNDFNPARHRYTADLYLYLHS